MPTKLPEETLAQPGVARDAEPVMTAQRSTAPGTDGAVNVETLSGQPQLYLLFQCDRPLEASVRFSLAPLRSILVGRGERRVSRRNHRERALRLELADSWSSSAHARFTDVLGRWVVEDLQSTNGTLVNGFPTTRAVLADGDLIEIGHTFFLYRESAQLSDEDSPELASGDLAPPAPGLSTLVPALGRDFKAVARIARSSVSVIVTGESGTGKELVARAVHGLSSRPGRFVAVNCGAIPAELVESELFGHQRGAFSGALQNRPGLVRSSDRGTLFLDEIGDLPAGSQASLLRVLQEKHVVPVGETRPINVDLRVVSATHRMVENLVSQRVLREDLYSRLNGFRLHLPPLRDRREDLGLLISDLLPRVAPSQASKVTFSRRAARALIRYLWPQNIRELERCVEAAVVLAGRTPIVLEHLPEVVRLAEAPGPSQRPKPPMLEEKRNGQRIQDERNREELIRLLSLHRGNLSAVARVVGKDRIQVRRWVKRYGIDLERLRASLAQG